MYKIAVYLSIIFIMIFYNLSAFAEIKEIKQTIRQPFGGSQSPDDARNSAIAKAKREALEKAGTYLDSLTVVRNGVLISDEVTMLTSGIIKLEVISQKNYVDGDSFGLIVSTKVTVDMDILNKRIQEYLNKGKHFAINHKGQKPSHLFPKDKTILSWFEDRAFLVLSYEEKRRIIINYFNAYYTDKKFYEQPLSEQDSIINNFVRAHIEDK